MLLKYELILASLLSAVSSTAAVSQSKVALDSLATSATELHQTVLDHSGTSYSKGFYRIGAYSVDEAQFSTDFCYKGKIDEVCALISADSKLSLTEYEAGDHFYVDVTSCKVNDDATLSVEGLIVNDYIKDAVRFEHEISACSVK